MLSLYKQNECQLVAHFSESTLFSSPTPSFLKFVHDMENNFRAGIIGNLGNFTLV